jgi:hypothetical protein
MLGQHVKGLAMRILTGHISGLALATLVIAGAALVSTNADAGTITVLNPSFELSPGGNLSTPLPLTAGCGAAAGCSYNSGSIPDWNLTGSGGLFEPGNNTVFFSLVPNGVTVAYANSGAVWQTVVNSMVAGVTYTLDVYVGFRTDMADDSLVGLQVGNNYLSGSFVSTSAGLQGSGTWGLYTTSLTATPADAGQILSVVLAETGGQGDYDEVSVSANPLPSTWTMLIAGFVGLFGFLAFGGKKRKVAATAAALT